MFLWNQPDDIGELFLVIFVCAIIGAFCGAVPLTVGLLRGHKSMAWMGFGFCVFLGAGCHFVALLPAIVFTIIVAVTEPIEKQRKKKGKDRKRRRRRERADDFLDDEHIRERESRDRRERGRRRREEEDDDDDDDYDDRPRRRRYD